MSNEREANPFKFPDPVDDGGADRGARTVTKSELADALFERLGLNKREAKDMVDAFFDEIRLALERGESVKLSGLRQFPVARQAAAAGAQSEDGRGDRHHRTTGGDLSRQPEAEGDRFRLAGCGLMRTPRDS
jgi:nucleoid DNA-binding protein